MTTASSAVGAGEPEAGINPANASTEPTDAKETSTAESSPAVEQDAKQPKSLLDAVKAAIKPEAGPTESSPADSAKSEGAADKAEGEKSPDANQPEDEPPPFHKHPAWQKRIQRERELTSEVETLKPKAERFDRMNQMMQSNGLTVDEVNAGFNIMALMRSDPAKALEALRPYVDTLEQLTGNKLPDDLTERVESGEITDAAAQEMARLRADKAQSDQRAQRESEARTQTERRAAADAMAKGVTTWERQWETSDPDYAKKLPLVRNAVIALRQERGDPKSVDEAIKLSKDALEAVDKQLGAVIKPKPAVKAPPVGSSVPATAAPKTLREAVQAGLERARRVA